MREITGLSLVSSVFLQSNESKGKHRQSFIPMHGIKNYRLAFFLKSKLWLALVCLKKVNMSAVIHMSLSPQTHFSSQLQDMVLFQHFQSFIYIVDIYNLINVLQKTELSMFICSYLLYFKQCFLTTATFNFGTLNSQNSLVSILAVEFWELKAILLLRLRITALNNINRELLLFFVKVSSFENFAHFQPIEFMLLIFISPTPFFLF